MRDHDGFTDSKHGSDDPVGRPRDHHGPAAPKRGTAVASDFSTVQHNLYTVLTLYSTVHTLCMPGAAPLLCGIDMEL
jgi:hypothetical protein